MRDIIVHQSIHYDLIERILNSDKIVILLSPAGFGKTEILKSIHNRILQNKLPHYWLDKYDHKRDPIACTNKIKNYVNRESSRQCCYIIDDIDLVDGKILIDTIEQAIHENTRLRFFIAARSLVNLPIAQLRAHDMIDIIDGFSLRMNEKMVKTMIGKSIDQRWRRRIEEISGGWPVAVQVFRKWASQLNDVPENWTTLEILKASGFDSYIEQELEPSFDDRTSKIMPLISQFDCANAALLSAIAPNENFDVVLPSLPYDFPGLIDKISNGIVLNPLIREYFASKFLERNLDSRKEFLMAGADYLAAHNNLAEAAILAKRGGFPERIEKYAVENGTLRIWFIDDYAVLKTLIDKAGPSVVNQSISLKLMQCIVHVKDGLIKDAKTLFQRIDTEIEDNDDLRIQADVVQATLLVYGCNFERSGDIENIARLFNHEKDDPVWRSLLATILCILHSQRGCFREALESLEDARVSAKIANSTYNLMFLNLHQAGIYIARGEMKSARVAMTNARGYWRREFDHDTGAQTVISALSASIEFESGQLTTARNSLKKSAYQMPNSEAWFDVYLAAYEPMARVIKIDKNIDDALRIIRENQRKLLSHGLPRVGNILGGLAICLWGEEKLKGNISLSCPIDEIPIITATAAWREREIYTLAQSYLLIDSDQLIEASQLLEAELIFAVDTQLRRSELRYRILLAVIYLKLSENDKAKQSLLSAIELGAETGLRQFFVDMLSIEKLYVLLQHISMEDNNNDIIRRFVLSLLSAKQRPLHTNNIAILKYREVEILKILAEGGSDKIIARQIGITEHGVRYHLKNIYRKLSVNDRVSALMKASTQGLI